MRRLPTYALPAAVLVWALAALNSSAAESMEYRVKAACLYKLLSFVEWPTEVLGDASKPLIVGVLGEDPFGTLLDQTVRDRTVGGRKIEVRRFSEAEAAKAAHLVFINLKGDALSAALKTLEGVPVLTVGESSAFVDSGGVVRFVIRDEKVAFEINPDAGRKARLSISAQLLKISRIVGRKGE